MGLSLALTTSCSLVIGIPDRSEAPADAASDAPADAASDAAVVDGDADETLDSEGDAADTATVETSFDGAADAPIETAVDAATDVPSAVAYCESLSPEPTFCDDFEGTFASRWTAKHPSASGTLSFDADDSVGPPKPGHSLLAATTAAETSYLEWSTSKVPSSFHLAFDFRADELPSSDVTYVARVRVGASEYVALYAIAGNTALQDFVYHPDGGAPSDHATSTAIAAGTWTRVELDVSFAVSPPSAKVRLGGKEVLSATLAGDFVAGSPTLELGVAFVNASAVRRFRYDNVVLDVK
jgi:hypothetical protein